MQHSDLLTKSPLLIRIFLVILWIVLFILVLQRDFFVSKMDIQEAEIIQKSREENYQGLYFAGERIGYVRSRMSPTDHGDIHLEQESILKLNILGEQHPVNMNLSALLSAKSVLKKFSFDFSSPLYKMQAHGEVDGLTLSFTLDTGKTLITDKMILADPPFLPTIQRGFLLRQDLESGAKLKIPFFDPFSLTRHERIVEYRGKEKILIHGRVRLLHHFSETFSGIRINSWLDDHGKVIKEESPAGFVLIAEPEFKARDIKTSGSEILSTVSVKIKGTMPDPEKLTSLTYRITAPEDAEIELHKDRQTGKGNRVNVMLEILPQGPDTPCSGQEAWLAASPYIQTNSPKIASLAEDISKNASTILEKTRLLAEWIYINLDKRPVIGIPDALTTLLEKKGDCNEHAALFTALARSVGIPARIAAGVTYHNKAFYYHAWNEICINDSWISLDTTKNQLPADVSHIKFTEGETLEMIKIGGVLGRLAIEVLPPGENDEVR